MLKILISSLLVILLTGCGAAAYHVKSEIDEATIVKDVTKGYVVFSRANARAVFTDPIFEYLPESETFKLVSILADKEKYIYAVSPGTHYFYSMGGESYDFVRVDVEAGSKYYVEITTPFFTWHVTIPLEFRVVKNDKDVASLDKAILVQNSAKATRYFNQRKDNPKFKAIVKERYNDWLEDDFEEKHLKPTDGFKIK